MPTPTRTGYTFLGWHGKNIIDICEASQGDANYPATYNSTSNELSFCNASTVSGNSYSAVQVQTFNSRTYNTTIIGTLRSGTAYASFTKSGTTQNTIRIKVNGNKADSAYLFDLSAFPDGEYTVSLSIKSSTASTTGPYAYENFVVNQIQIEYGGDFTQYESPRTITSTSQNTSVGDHTLTARWKANTYTVSYNLNPDWDSQGILSYSDKSTWSGNNSTITWNGRSFQFHITTDYDPYCTINQTMYLTAGKQYVMHAEVRDSSSASSALSTGGSIQVFYAINKAYNEPQSVRLDKSTQSATFSVSTTGTYNIRIDNDYHKDIYIFNFYVTEYLAPKQVTFDEPYGTLPTPTRSGYTFLGWQDSDGNTITALTTCTTAADHTLYAQWKENAVSYLSNDWRTRVFTSDSEANAVQSIVFTKDSSKISGLTNSISVGTISPTSTAAYTSTTGVEDVKAYYKSKTSIVIYSPRTIYAPQNSQFLFCRESSTSGNFKALTTLNLSNFNTSNVTNMSYMFLRCSALTSLDLSNFNTSKVTDMSYMFCYCSAFTSLNLSNFNTSNVTDMSAVFRGCSTLTSLDVSNFNTSKVADMIYMFYNCSKLTTLDLSNFNTSKVTDMRHMFRNCSALTSLNVSNFNTSKVTSMYYMFNNCSNLITLDVSNFDTSKVTDMSYMFQACFYLTNLDVSGFNTSNVTDMSYMFQGCSCLTSLDVSGFNTSNVTNMRCMFYSCDSLPSLNVSNFDTSNVSKFDNMFNECTALRSLDLGNFNLQSYSWNVSSSRLYLFDECINLGTIVLPYNLRQLVVINLPANNYYKGNAGPYGTVGTSTSGTTVACSTASNKVTLVKETVVSYLSGDWTTRLFSTDAEANAVQSIVFTRDSSKIAGLANSISLGTISPTSTAAYTSTTGVEDVKAYYNDKTNIVIYSPRIIFAPQSCEYLFCRGNASSGALKALTTLDLSNFNTSNVTNMTLMFSYCSALTSLDLSNFNTSKVLYMGSMFYNCSALTSLDLSSFRTGKVTSMDAMFYNCSALTSLNLSSFSTSSVTNMTQMFYYCSALTSLDVSGFNTSSVAYMGSMFYRCSKLTSLEVSNFDTSNVTSMDNIFYYCSALTSLDVSNFNTSKVTNMKSMFRYCYALTSLDVSNFNTSNVTDMSYMFHHCSALTTLDVSNFNTSKVTVMEYMFEYCNALTSLNVSNFDTSKVTSMNSMFYSCKALTNLNLGNFNLQSCTVLTWMLSSCTNLQTIVLPYNLQSGKTISLPARTFYKGSAGPYGTVGTSTSGTTVACSTASSKVTLTKK